MIVIFLLEKENISSLKQRGGHSKLVDFLKLEPDFPFLQTYEGLGGKGGGEGTAPSEICTISPKKCDKFR